MKLSENLRINKAWHADPFKHKKKAIREIANWCYK